MAPKSMNMTALEMRVIPLFERFKTAAGLITCDFQKLEESLHIRNQWFRQQRESLSLRTRLHFIILLSERDYSGTLEISHTDETIEPIVKLNNLLCHLPLIMYYVELFAVDIIQCVIIL